MQRLRINMFFVVLLVVSIGRAYSSAAEIDVYRYDKRFFVQDWISEIMRLKGNPEYIDNSERVAYRTFVVQLEDCINRIADNTYGWSAERLSSGKVSILRNDDPFVSHGFIREPFKYIVNAYTDFDRQLYALLESGNQDIASSLYDLYRYIVAYQKAVNNFAGSRSDASSFKSNVLAQRKVREYNNMLHKDEQKLEIKDSSVGHDSAFNEAMFAALDRFKKAMQHYL